MLGAVMSGKLADLFGRRGVSFTVTLRVLILLGMTENENKNAPKLISYSVIVWLFFDADNGIC